MAVGLGSRDTSARSVGDTSAAVRATALEFKPTACSKTIERSASTPPVSWIWAVMVLPENWGVSVMTCAAAGTTAHKTRVGTSAGIRLMLPPLVAASLSVVSILCLWVPQASHA